MNVTLKNGPWTTVLVVFNWMLVLSSPAVADGTFFTAVGTGKPAYMKAQRAFIRFKDGQQTLMIEAAVDSESKNLGWVIPLPAYPEKIRPVKRGFFESLSFCLRINVSDDLGWWNSVLFISVNLFIPILFIVLLLNWTRKSWPLGVILGLVWLLLVVPSLFRFRMGGNYIGIPGVKELSEQRIGSYDTTVLQATSPETLDNWLTQNGFVSLADEEKKVIRDYIAQQWCFFAAKLVRDKAGSGRPHPIAFDFASEQAIYPIRLTAFSSENPYFEIFVAGTAAAQFPHLHTELCDRFFYESYAWTAENTGVAIGHPELVDLFEMPDLFWDGCVVTKLTGFLSRAQMFDDVVLQWNAFTPHRDHFYSHRAAKLIFYCVFCLLSTVLTSIIAIIYRQDLGIKGRRKHPLRSIFLCLMLSLLVSVVTYSLLPKKLVSRYSTSSYYSLQRWLEDGLAHDFHEGPSPDTVTVRTRIKAILDDYRLTYGGSDTNPFTGDPIREEVSPGNYEVRQYPESGCIVVYYYNDKAIPYLAWQSPYDKEKGMCY
ncbi:DUF2330 domain-containing protein [candidate division CSSED10-310 bacterium]|uniref:DUF2330 domain-containing protein n=1 Tax=candidate division CSSED10-310 bacterium TaxID=2855610 RepID=A0ABV6Z227_UNCC1